jgi:7,8-dihydropterin-6-yl-methyl-4-(beta-D-ribofuranosyl)aminobenzene 5'-phosphate synthase
MKIAVVYDNRTLDPELSSAWGFSCLVGDDLLFDTGGDGPRLLSNIERMGLDVGRIKTVVLSHAHGDHTGGLGSILAVSQGVTVYLPRSFPARFKEQVKAHARVVEVLGPMEIAEGVYTTGEMGRGLVEQALVWVTGPGLVVATGCAHPGIVEMMRRAKQIGGSGIYLAIGGFHLGGASESRIAGIVEDFQQLGVRRVAPCHCSGDVARRLFGEAYGADFVPAGVGSRLEVRD